MAVLARASTRELERALQAVLAGTAGVAATERNQAGNGAGSEARSEAESEARRESQSGAGAGARARTQPTRPWPAFDWLRAPEIGLAMVRGRVGGTGDPFNLGEVTVTRATLRLHALDSCTPIGVAWHLGRDKRRAECAALLDALLQIPARRDAALACAIEPLAARQAEQRAARNRAAAATKVEFFTMVRGD
jgi:alpha-D-ribose 1-methylphosphonate 5-triphosphate synthase subunit PhnG